MKLLNLNTESKGVISIIPQYQKKQHTMPYIILNYNKCNSFYYFMNNLHTHSCTLISLVFGYSSYLTFVNDLIFFESTKVTLITNEQMVFYIKMISKSGKVYIYMVFFKTYALRTNHENSEEQFFGGM